jgi:hypothetical protein
MAENERMAFIRAIKRQAATLLALYVLGPSSETKLARNLAMNPETIRAHLITLGEYGYVTRKNRFAWIITPAAENLLLPKGYELMRGKSAYSGVQSAENPRTQGSIRGKSAYSNDLNTAAPSAIQLPSIKVEAEVVEDQYAENPRIDFGKFKDNLDCLKAHHIGEPVRSKLARLAWISPEWIDDWITILKDEQRYSPGLLIHILREGDEPYLEKVVEVVEYANQEEEIELEPAWLAKPEEKGELYYFKQAVSEELEGKARRYWDEAQVAVVGEALQIKCKDAATCDWMRERLGKFLERKLVGWMPGLGVEFR